MLHLYGAGTQLCDGSTRREFLRVGGLSLAGLTLPALFRAQGAGARPRVKSVLQLFLWGGPSQLETFDLKPHAPDGIRGLFRPVATSVPGTRVGEHLPRLACRAHRYAILRSVTHTGVNHGTSAYHMLTGHIHAQPGTLRHPAPDDRPSVGCAAARFGRQPRDLPAYVALPSVVLDGDGGEVPGQGPGLLGLRFAPFRVLGDPSRRDFSLDTLRPPSEVDARRLRGRVGLRAALDRHGERLARTAADLDGHYERAFRLLRSSAGQKAFDLAAEPEPTRERYGWHPFAQSCLLARRLIEAGVPLVTAYWNAPTNTDNQSWDTHTNSFRRLQDHVLPPFDRALSALMDDLHDRGLLDQTLIVCMGEFGRTPRINRNAGRDHWGFCQSVLLAGGGVRGGLVYGSSDAQAAYAAEQPVSPDDLAATVFHALGIPADREIQDSQGRPLALCRGKPVLGVF